MAAPSASGTNAIAGGFGSSASGANAIGIGAGSSASGLESVAIGTNAVATGGKAVSIGSRNVATGNGAVAIGDPNIATGTGAVAVGNNNQAIGQGAVALGNASLATGASAVAIGDTAIAAVDGAIAVGFNTTASGVNGTAIGSLAKATGNNSVAVGANSSDGGIANVFAVGGTAAGQQRRVVNVAAGTVSATSTDAVNGAQLSALSSSVDTRFAQIGFSGPYTTNNISLGIGASAGVNATAYGVQSAAPGAGGVAVGYQSNATGINGVALGNGAVVQSGATGGVAIGAGSVASAPNTVSFGNPGNERRLTNVAPGVNPTDAVNLSQLGTMFNTAQDDIKRANGGVAMALGAASVQLPLEVGEMGVVGSAGLFRGDTAFNFKYQMRPTEDIVFGLGVGVTTHGGNVGASAGVGYKWR
nr:hypothetical protein [Polymorphobacter fuscus]